MTKPLCYAPWINLLRKNKKGYAPCCVSDRRQFDSFEEYQNSEWLNDIKKTMLKNEWPPACNYCKKKEEQNIESDRPMYDKYYNGMNSDFETIDFPPYIDIRYSNTCNLKCRMCSPHSSSKIENEYEKDPESYEKYYGPFNQNQIIEGFDFTNKHIRKIKVLGGEPTVDIGLHKFLKNIIANNTVDKISFTTNGTNLNEHFMKILESVKLKDVTFSVDAVDKTYEYIRTNSKWDIVNKNIHQAFKEMDFSTYGFNVVLTPYLAFNINALFNWFLSLHTKGYDFWIIYDQSDVSFTSLNCLTEEHLEFLRRSVYDWIEKNSTPEYIYRDALILIENTVSNEKNRETFIRYNNYLDKIRNTNIIELDSRFGEYTNDIEE